MLVMNASEPYFASDDPAVEQADDLELLLRISYRKTNPDDAKAAFTLFFYRHAEFLRCACERFGFCHPSVPAEGVTTHVMARVFAGNVHDFRAPQGVTDPDDIMRLVRAWLIELAKFTFFDERKKVFNKAEVLNFVPDDDPPTEDVVTPRAFEVDEPALPTAPERTAILAMRDALSKEEQLLLDRSVDYYDPVSGDCKVPPAVARGLARELGISVPGARKRRERLFAHLRSRLEMESAQTAR